MLRFGIRSSVRRRASQASVLAGAVVVALGIGAVGAGSAVAHEGTPACTGATTILGEGASLQGVAQREVWSPLFESNICPGIHVQYEAKGSGAGLGAWDFNNETSFNNTRDYTASDDGPTKAQVENAEKAAGTQVVVIPVGQTSIAVAVHPPANCEVEELPNKVLEEVFRGVTKRWGQLGSYAHGSGCAGQNITRVVRFDGSGTTYQFKNYLSLINVAPLACTEGSKTWQELEPIRTSNNPNTTWPENGKGGCGATTLSPVITAGKNGNGPLIQKMNETPGSIGYSAVSDIETNRTGNTHWIALQNNGNRTASATFAVPQEGGVANCAGASYTVPVGARVGELGVPQDPTTEGLWWSHAFGADVNAGGFNYPLCTITFDMALTEYSKAGFSEAAYQTVKDYLTEYVTATQGQEDLEESGHWYAQLPTGGGKPKHNVLGAAERAASYIGY